MFVDNGLTGVASTLTRKDLNWINKKPLRCVNLGDYLCGYTVYIYEESRDLNQLIKKIKMVLTQLRKEEQEGDYGLDKRLHEEIDKFEGKKVVVVGGCTC